MTQQTIRKLPGKVKRQNLFNASLSLGYQARDFIHSPVWHYKSTFKFTKVRSSKAGVNKWTPGY
jgi:hypothetical protein